MLAILNIADQAIMQRYLACTDLPTAKRSVYIWGVALLFAWQLPALSGMAIYAYYANCDPINAKWVESADQLIPYLVASVFKPAPGLTGLFMVGLMSGTLSTVSSVIQAASILFLDDFLIES